MRLYPVFVPKTKGTPLKELKWSINKALHHTKNIFWKWRIPVNVTRVVGSSTAFLSTSCIFNVDKPQILSSPTVFQRWQQKPYFWRGKIPFIWFKREPVKNKKQTASALYRRRHLRMAVYTFIDYARSLATVQKEGIKLYLHNIKNIPMRLSCGVIHNCLGPHQKSYGYSIKFYAKNKFMNFSSGNRIIAQEWRLPGNTKRINKHKSIHHATIFNSIQRK